jgi:hypothetical protein
MRIDLIAVKPLVIEGCGVPEIEKAYLAFMSEGVPLEQQRFCKPACTEIELAAIFGISLQFILPLNIRPFR